MRAPPDKPLQLTAAPRSRPQRPTVARGGLPRARSSLPDASSFTDAAVAERRYVARTGIAAVPRLTNSILQHAKLGVPAAATAHAIVHCICEAVPVRDLWILPFYVFLGAIVGSIVLVPAFAGQALLMHFLSTMRIPLAMRAVAAGALQSGFVWIWSLTIGLEPSSGSWLPVTPWMMTAAFLVGAGTTYVVALRLARPISGITTALL